MRVAPASEANAIAGAGGINLRLSKAESVVPVGAQAHRLVPTDFAIVRHDCRERARPARQSCDVGLQGARSIVNTRPVLEDVRALATHESVVEGGPDAEPEAGTAEVVAALDRIELPAAAARSDLLPVVQ